MMAGEGRSARKKRLRSQGEMRKKAWLSCRENSQIDNSFGGHL